MCDIAYFTGAMLVCLDALSRSHTLFRYSFRICCSVELLDPSHSRIAITISALLFGEQHLVVANHGPSTMMSPTTVGGEVNE